MKMQKTWVFGLMISAAAPAAIAATDCVAIKQDKARLKCFDELARTPPAKSETRQPQKSAEEVAKERADFNKKAATFLSESQAYLAAASMGWQSHSMNPAATPAATMIEKSKKYRSDMEIAFQDLLGMPGGTAATTPMLKDYFAAWGLAYDSVRPSPGDSYRVLAARADTEMNRIKALAERLKMDL